MQRCAAIKSLTASNTSFVFLQDGFQDLGGIFHKDRADLRIKAFCGTIEERAQRERPCTFNYNVKQMRTV